MDPLHPIVPVSPNIPSVSPAPRAGGVDRDGAHGGAGRDQRRRKQPDAPAAHATVDGSDYYLDDPGEGDDSGLHINVTA
jgi:hypothetical protein